MGTGFQDSIGKRIIREKWDTPILNYFKNYWQTLYFYFGMPGKRALDIILWKSLIRRVVAFEVENNGDRSDIIELQRQLNLLGINHELYCGYFENVIIQKRDIDNKHYRQDDLVTLYNLDFCDSITSKILTSAGNKCLRFEALRTILDIQHQISQSTSQKKFILFLTIRDQIHTLVLREFLKLELPASIRDFNNSARKVIEVKAQKIQRHTLLTKSFVFHALRTYFQGHGVTSYFYPLIRYTGASVSSPMLHFVILCSFDSEETAYPGESQRCYNFLRSKSYEVKGNSIIKSPFPIESMDIDPSNPKFG